MFKRKQLPIFHGIYDHILDCACILPLIDLQLLRALMQKKKGLCCHLEPRTLH
uniref:Uncharacterized protein n=1 Tax=Mesocestoides corti TaxID=53468 RepID=A0A5K3FR23_MESCO